MINLNRVIAGSLRGRRTVAALALAIATYGIWTALSLPVDVLPDLNRPTVTVMTEAHGLVPEDVERLVTRLVEQAVSGAEPGDVDKAADEATLSRIERSASEAIRFYERNRRLIDRAALQGEESVPIGEKTYSLAVLENGSDYAKRLKEQ